MPRYRLSRLAEADVVTILASSHRQWGVAGRRRHAALLSAAMRKIAAEPLGPTTRGRDELRPGVRSFHLRQAGGADLEGQVRRPVHVLYYRTITPDLIEIVRVLHERMEPSRHLHEISKD
ncbi:MAG TPA: type II toxin-antitoxin system RelE/ParE family toxin [Stellaceae bacterium]|nr:type II toxin-antitoxin system RelE/ParE family toxin [Stellaceae bacterium]